MLSSMQQVAVYLLKPFLLPDAPDKGLMRNLKRVEDAAVCWWPGLLGPGRGVISLNACAQSLKPIPQAGDVLVTLCPARSDAG